MQLPACVLLLGGVRGWVLSVLCPACFEGSELLCCEADSGGGVASVASTDPAWKKMVCC